MRELGIVNHKCQDRRRHFSSGSYREISKGEVQEKGNEIAKQAFPTLAIEILLNNLYIYILHKEIKLCKINRFPIFNALILLTTFSLYYR